MSHDPPAAERRKQARYKVGGVPIRFWFSSEQSMDAMMLDASPRGAALIACSAKVALLKPGDRLRVVRNDLEQAATIRSIKGFGKGQCRLAITWD